MGTFNRLVDATGVKTSDQTSDETKHAVKNIRLRRLYQLPHENVEKTSSGDQRSA